MTGLRMTLGAMTIGILLFTLAAIAQGGLDLITPFVKPLIGLTWQGQFHFDFLCYLILSGIWMAWRCGFSAQGIALGIIAPPLGILFLAPYLLYLIMRSGGDARRLVLGVQAAVE